jgi:hypothetical protein
VHLHSGKEKRYETSKSGETADPGTRRWKFFFVFFFIFDCAKFISIPHLLDGEKSDEKTSLVADDEEAHVNTLVTTPTNHESGSRQNIKTTSSSNNPGDPNANDDNATLTQKLDSASTATATATTANPPLSGSPRGHDSVHSAKQTGKSNSAGHIKLSPRKGISQSNPSLSSRQKSKEKLLLEKGSEKEREESREKEAHRKVANLDKEGGRARAVSFDEETTFVLDRGDAASNEVVKDRLSVGGGGEKNASLGGMPRSTSAEAIQPSTTTTTISTSASDVAKEVAGGKTPNTIMGSSSSSSNRMSFSNSFFFSISFFCFFFSFFMLIALLM